VLLLAPTRRSWKVVEMVHFVVEGLVVGYFQEGNSVLESGMVPEHRPHLANYQTVGVGEAVKIGCRYPSFGPEWDILDWPVLVWQPVHRAAKCWVLAADVTEADID
jgi:hypothetical protein